MRDVGTLRNLPDIPDRIVTVAELAGPILPYDRTTLWRWSRDGRFPKPIQLSAARKGWRWSTILAWMEEREAHPIEPRAYFRKTKDPAAGKGERGSERRSEVRSDDSIPTS